MQKKKNSLSKELEIVNELGLHARSASQIALLAQKATDRIWLQKGTAKVDATSILDILTLGCPKGSKIIIFVEHYNDINVLNNIAGLIENGFGEL